MADQIYMTVADAVRTVVYDLQIDGAGDDLSSATVECHMKNVSTGTVITSAAVTVDADQVTYPGRVSTEFSGTELVSAGVFTLEWEVTIGAQVVTYPGKAADRPVLTVREEAA
jgi:hypothetical protein